MRSATSVFVTECVQGRVAIGDDDGGTSLPTALRGARDTDNLASMVRWIMRVFVVVILCLIACSSGDPDTTPAAPAAKKSEAATIPFDLSTLTRTVHFAFRARGAGFVAAHETYGVAYEHGLTTVTPRFDGHDGAPLRLRTIAIANNEAAASRATLEADGAVAIDHGVAVERVRNGDDGPEQSWTFAERPRGELAVRVAATGLSYVGSSATGLHFAESDGHGVRYGVATLIDARGRRVTVRPTFAGDAIELRVPNLDDLVFPAVLDPIVSPEFGIDRPVLGPSVRGAYSPQVAFNGTDYVVVWAETAGSTSGTLYTLYGARVSTAGAILDPTGFVIASGMRDSSFGIACAAKCLVAYTNYLAPGNTRAQFIDSTGALSGSSIDLGQPYTRFLAVASDGTNFLVAFRAGLNLGSMIVTPTGTVTVASTTLAADLPERRIFAAAGSTGYLVGFARNDNNAYVARLTAAGTAVRPAQFLGAAYWGVTGIAWDGLRWLVATTEGSATTVHRINDDGTIASTVPITGGFAGVASDGTTSSMVVSGPSSALLATRILRDGTVVAGGSSSPGGSGNTPISIARGTTNYLMAYTRQRAATASRIDSSGAFLDTPRFVVNIAANSQLGAAVAYDGSGWLVAWLDTRGTPADASAAYKLVVARIDSTGAVLDPSGIVLGDVYYTVLPNVAFDGTNYLVGWFTSGTAYQYVRVSKAGAVVDSTPIALSGPRDTVRLACAGATCAFAWQSSTLGVIRVSGSTVLDTTPLTLATFTSWGGTSGLGLATDGAQFFLAWGESGTLGAPAAMRVPTTGSAGPKITLPAPITPPTRVSAAWDGGRFVVSWVTTGSNPLVAPTLDVVRVSSTGSSLDTSPRTVLTGAFNTREPIAHASAGDGYGTLLVWAVQNKITQTNELNAAFMGPTEPSPTAPLVFGPDGRTVAAVSNGKGRRLVVFDRFESASTLRSDRLSAVWIDGFELGRGCATATECMSGLCTDGVCCESTCTSTCAACDVAGSRGRCVANTGLPHGTRRCGMTGDGTVCAARCDGVDETKCVYPADGAVNCSSDTCATGVETHLSTCDNAGKCKDVPKSCGAFACGTTTCRTACTSTSECASGFYCKDSTCVPADAKGVACSTATLCATGLTCVDGVCCESSSCSSGSSCALAGWKGTCRKVDSTICSADTECGSGFCVDGVCCNERCDGQCQTCDATGKLGVCTPIDGAPHGTRPKCDDGGSSVCAARICNGGTDPKTCVGYANKTEKECKAAACEGTSFLAASVCDGAGSCKPAEPASCVPFACAPTGCLTSCSGDSQCAPGFGCKDGKCVAQTAECTADKLSSRNTKDGTEVACAPYRCTTAGTCGSLCSGTADCSPGYVCDVPSSKCIAAATDAGDDASGCGCRLAPNRTSRSATLAALVMLAVMRRRRRA
jgi:hypothetical protein